MPDWRRGYIRQYPWLRIQGKSAPGVHLLAPLSTDSGIFCPKGTSTGGSGYGGFRPQGYIRRHPWKRFKPISAPGVHPSAPLATDSGKNGPMGTTACTFGSGGNVNFENKCLSLKTSNKTNHGRRKDYFFDERGEQDSPSQQQSNS